MQRYKVALIGCGGMGEAHLQEIYDKDTVDLVYVCDVDIERARLFQKKYRAQNISSDYHECIEGADIVIIATLPSTHLAIFKECIRHKKHVLCEKPLCANLEDGAEFVQLVKENPEVKVLIGHILRHHAAYQKIADMLHEDAVGKPMIFRMVQHHHAMNWPRYQRMLEEVSPLVDCGVHYLDVMKWFCEAEVKGFQAMGVRMEQDIPLCRANYCLVSFRFTDGSMGYYEAGYGNTLPSDNLKEFVGPKGRIRLTYQNNRQNNQEEGDLIEYYHFPEKIYETINVPCKRKPTDTQFEHLLAMIEKNEEAIPSIDEAFSVFKTMLEAEAMINEGNKTE